MTSINQPSQADSPSPQGISGPAENRTQGMPSGEFAVFGAVHLNNTSLENAVAFWTRVIGLEIRSRREGYTELGTAGKTLVAIHETAKTGFQEGFSGLYHFAIHAPDEAAFAQMLHRLVTLRYPFSPVDHTMSKALYLQDPDGITVELTLETPHRLRRILTERGLQAEDTEGKLRSLSDRLDLQETLQALPGHDHQKPVADGTRIGHVHFYAMHLADEFAFYEKLGFEQFNYLPQYQYADLGAGGAFRHRVAMNTWHGRNRPVAPADQAGLRHLEILINSQEKLREIAAGLANGTQSEEGHWISDPSRNLLLLRGALDEGF